MSTEAERKPRSSATHPLHISVGGLVGCLTGVFALALALNGVDFAALTLAFSQVGYGPLIAAFLAHFVVQIIYGMRWRYLLNQPDNFSLRRAVGFVGIGYLANYTLPGRPGELIRAGLARGVANIPFARGLSSLLLEKSLDGITIMASAFLFALFAPIPQWLSTSILFGSIAFAIGAGILFAAALAGTKLESFVTRSCSALIPGHLVTSWHIQPIVQSTFRNVGHLGDPLRSLVAPRNLIAVIGLGMLNWLAIVLQLGILCLGFNIDQPGVWLLLYAALGLVSVVPGAPGYLGTYQFAAVLAFGAFALPPEQAIVVATLYQVARLLSSLCVGSWAISHEGTGIFRLATHLRATSRVEEPVS